MSRWVWFTIALASTLVADAVLFTFIALGLFGVKLIIGALLFNLIMGGLIHLTLDF